MSGSGLTAPSDDDEILEWEPEALRLKPVMTGDVFVGVSVAGAEKPIDVMVAGHPCTIRRGVELAARIPCVRIVSHQWVPYHKWPDYDTGHFPLSEEIGLGKGLCAALDDWVSVDKTELQRGRRRLTLQNQGIYILQQRLIHSLSRFRAPLTSLKEASGHVLAEAELEYTWIFDLTGTAELEALIAGFDHFMTVDDRRGKLRSDPGRVRKAVREEIRSRLAEPA